MTIEEKWLLIRNYNLWADISNEEYQELNIIHRYIEAPNGDYLYFEAHHHNRVYFLKQGYIRIGFIDDNGNEVIREILQKGDFFGQITLERNNLRGEYAQAYKSDVSLCAFLIEDFLELLKKKPEIGLKYAKQMGVKLRQVESRLINMLNKDVKTRLINFIWQLINQLPLDANENEYFMDNFLTHEDIAHLIGSSRQTVTTFINELSDEGLFQINRKFIKVPNLKNLEKRTSVI